MIVLHCPYCHEQRTEDELTNGGEAGVERPPADKASDQQWTDYLFMRANRKGLHHEQWCCSIAPREHVVAHAAQIDDTRGGGPHRFLQSAMPSCQPVR